MTELNKGLGNRFSQIISFCSVKEHKNISLHHFILNFVLKMFKRNCAFDLFKDVPFKYYSHIQEGKHIVVSFYHYCRTVLVLPILCSIAFKNCMKDLVLMLHSLSFLNILKILCKVRKKILTSDIYSIYMDTKYRANSNLCNMKKQKGFF